MMKAILTVLRDLQTSLAHTGLQLRVTQAGTITEIKQQMAPPGARACPELLLFSMSARDTACIDDLLLLAGKNPQLQTVLLVRQQIWVGRIHSRHVGIQHLIILI